MKKERLRWYGGVVPNPAIEMTDEQRAEDLADDIRIRELLKTALKNTGVKYKTASKGIPIELLITLRRKRIPINAIARIVKCSPASVRERLRRAGIESVDMVEEFKKNRADVLAFHQKRILDSVNNDNLNNASLKDKIMSFGTLYDKERIETGKSVGDGKFMVAIVNYGDKGNDFTHNPHPSPISTPTSPSPIPFTLPSFNPVTVSGVSGVSGDNNNDEDNVIDVDNEH